MHEVGLMQGALELAIAEAERHGARHIHQITLRVGRLAGVEPEALAFAFEVVTAGTMAEGARLEVESVPVVCHCPDCRDEFRPADFIFACPRCGRLSRDVRYGEELELATLEVS
jgi:hydrogenase nickel incorporation protein HypA/HybF